MITLSLQHLQNFINETHPTEITVVARKEDIDKIQAGIDFYRYAFASDPVSRVDALVLDYLGVPIKFKVAE